MSAEDVEILAELNDSKAAQEFRERFYYVIFVPTQVWPLLTRRSIQNI